MRFKTWLALLLVLGLLSSMLPAALSEEIQIDMEDPIVTEGEDVDLDLELSIDDIPLTENLLTLDLPPLEQEGIPEPAEGSAQDVDAADEYPVSNGKNYTDLSNDTAFVLNGVTVRASDEGTKGSGNCWKWAQAIYKKVWGCNFDSTFVGTASKGHNLLRNLTDSERELTPENLKYFVSHAVPGATLRVQSCPSSCSGFNTDGCSKHEKHSLIIAEIRDDGLVTMDDQGSVHTRYYTWEGFCNSWAKKWVYVKYIKWPNAPALTSIQSIDGYGVSKCSETYRVRSTASNGTPVCSLPENGKQMTTLKYPATFSADAKALKTYSGYSWVHGTSSTGVTGWLPLTDAVASSTETISVTGVALDQTTLILAKGGTATLKAAVAPVDATNQNVSWSSSDNAVVTVNGGVVTATGAGTATVTVTTVDGGKEATCEVKVSNAEYSKELTQTGSNGTVKLPVGKTLQLIPTFATSNGWKIKSVSSSDGKCASVNKYGQVTGKKAGTATITVKTKNGKKATLKVQVVNSSSTGGDTDESKKAVAPTKIILNKTGTVKLKVGKTMQLYTKLTPSNATTTLTWASSDEKVAYVDQNGKVYAIKEGKCKIGVKTANDLYAWVTVKVE